MWTLMKNIRQVINHLFYFIVNSTILKVRNVSHAKFNINGILKIFNIGTLTLGNNFSGNSGKNKNAIGGDTILRLIVFRKNATLRIGDNVGMSNSTIVCWDRIEIGNNVLIGGSCKIWDTNFHSLNPQARGNEEDNDVKTAPIYIKDNVFIGAGAMILKGVTIGENSIIAAGSVVNKTIPPNVIAGGNPCIIIKELNFNNNK
jgi:acetyltransferase-like isoleucine patch superfamily enzyme